MSDLGQGKPRRAISLPAGGTAEEILSALAASVPKGPEAILQFADAAAQAGSAAAPETRERTEAHLLFSLERQSYGIPIERVLEIVRVGDVARIPGAPPHVRGVMNLRGRLLPVVELRTRITLQALELTLASRIIVVEALGRTLGILVDAVSDIERLAVSQMEPPPVEAASGVTDYVRAVYRGNARVVLLVDVERALHIPKADTSGAQG